MKVEIKAGTVNQIINAEAATIYGRAVRPEPARARSEVPLASRIFFLSYRRGDSRQSTERIYDGLVSRFGREAVFKDVDSIGLGRDFRRVLHEAVHRCDVFLPVIGDRWLSLTDDSGQRRLDHPDDLVRVEIETALRRPILVIPVLVDQAQMPRAENLPTSLRELAYRQAAVISPDPLFHRDLDRLILALESKLTSGMSDGFDPTVDSLTRG